LRERLNKENGKSIHRRGILCLDLHMKKRIISTTIQPYLDYTALYHFMT